MADFCPLELAALRAIGAESSEWAVVVDQLFVHGSVRSRRNTGGGFFSEVDRNSDRAKIVLKNQASRKDVWLGVERLEHGLGIILHLKDDDMALLEGYAVGPEDTSGIDFERARFEVVDQPGPLPNTGR